MSTLSHYQPTSYIMAPEILIQDIVFGVGHCIDLGVLSKSFLNLCAVFEEDMNCVTSELASSQETIAHVRGPHADALWNGLDAVVQKGSEVHFALQSRIYTLLQHYKDLELLRKVNSLVLEGPEGKKGTLVYWISSWDEIASFINFKKGLNQK